MFEEDMYVVIAFDEEFPQGAMCHVDGGSRQFAPKKICKDFVKTTRNFYPTTEYKIYKLKAKETI